MQLQSEGLSTFELEFHIPFYAWRRCDRPIQDSRQKADGEPLRRTKQLAFLSMPTSKSDIDSFDYLYEAQISCTVTGLDNKRWVAYFFIDTYFENSTEKESVLYYEEQRRHGMHGDPLTAGRHDAEMPIWTPREYFLRVLETRTDQIKREWDSVVSKVQRSVEQCVCCQSFSYGVSILQLKRPRKQPPTDIIPLPLYPILNYPRLSFA